MIIAEYRVMRRVDSKSRQHVLYKIYPVGCVASAASHVIPNPNDRSNYHSKQQYKNKKLTPYTLIFCSKDERSLKSPHCTKENC